jgi:hypothetical protein
MVGPFTSIKLSPRSPHRRHAGLSAFFPQLAAQRSQQAHRCIGAGVRDLDIPDDARGQCRARLHDQPVEAYGIPDRVKAQRRWLDIPTARGLVPADELRQETMSSTNGLT